MAVFVNPISVLPQSSEGYYTINNQFQESGPKGFTELKILENGMFFARLDLPGILKQCLTLSLDPSKKIMLIDAFAPSLNINDSSPRTYFNCPYRFPRSLNPDADDSELTGLELQRHPGVSEGSSLAYEAIKLVNGGLYVHVDMPGVPKDSFNVSVTNGRVRVNGQAPAVSHDSAGRFYSGDVAVLSAPVDLPISRISIIAKYGVIRLIIRPPL